MSAVDQSWPGDPGGKARNLLELQRAGFRVPEFRCARPDLAQAVAELGLPLAVRSSASVEDGGTHSFAGQFRSFLNLCTLDEVRAAVRQCEESLHNPSVDDYCRRHGIDAAGLRMAVIVQRMVQPELAGVAFTVNPSSGAEEVVIEACAGLADRLLAGEQPPLPAGDPLLERHAPAIARVARAIARHFGAPQDIEFAVAGGEVHIVQARPVTRIQFAPATGEWTNADFRDGGVSSGVCTPLMWSLYDYVWEPTLKGFLRELRLLVRDFPAGRMFFGRPYWNLGAVKECLARLPGFVEREFDRDLGVEPAYPGEGVRTPVSWPRIVRALPTLAAVRQLWGRQEQAAARLLDGAGEALLEAADAGGGEEGFGRLVTDAYRVIEGNYFRTIFCASLAKIAFVDSFPEADYAALVAALPPMSHLEPTRVMREMAAAGRPDVALLQRRFAHRARRELDLREPRWDEDPEWVAALLAAQGTEPPRDPRPAYEEARRAALAGLPARRRRAFARKLDRLRRFLWLREEMRDLSSRAYHRLRRRVLEVAARRGLGDDVFFMTFQQVLAGERGSVEANRGRYESFRNFAAPNEIGGRFTFHAGPPPRGALAGIAASRGTARGTARVARTIEEAGRTEPGAILVCPFTDPGWTPVLDRVAAVVTETGGMLSHAAVICRECGIPAVLGVVGATRRIRDGATVAVDGDRGCVEPG